MAINGLKNLVSKTISWPAVYHDSPCSSRETSSNWNHNPSSWGSQEEPSSQGGEAEEPTEKLAEEISIEVLERPIDEDTKKGAGQAIHWGYGMGWGILYGVAQNMLHLPSLLHGTLLGGLVGTVASTAVPAMGLTPPPTREPMSKNLMMFVLHLMYGWATALTFRALSSRS